MSRESGDTPERGGRAKQTAVCAVALVVALGSQGAYRAAGRTDETDEHGPRAQND
jgi:hypothetical protein